MTAVDVLVSFDRDGVQKWSSGRGAPRGLEPKDFEVLYDGDEIPVVAVEYEAQPWTVVVYFDQAPHGLL